MLQDEDSDEEGESAQQNISSSLSSLKLSPPPSSSPNTKSSLQESSSLNQGVTLSPTTSYRLNEWILESSRYPTPSFSLSSPEMHYLLNAWSMNHKKVSLLLHWMHCIESGQLVKLFAEFPASMELPQLMPEVKDGFLTMVVPLLRRQTLLEIKVFCRFHTDVRIDLRMQVRAR